MAGISDILRSHSALSRLLIINCVIFIFMMVCEIVSNVGGSSLFMAAQVNLALPASFIAFAQHPWTLLTYMFTHENFFHILFNMLWLLWFGYMFLAERSPRELVQLYLVGGLGGGLLYMALFSLFPGFYGSTVLMGASACVMAIMTATAVLMPNYTLHLFFIGDVKLKWMAVAMILLAFLGLGGGNAGGGVAHIGGVIAGLCMGLYMKRNPAGAAHKQRRKNPFKHLNQTEINKIRQRQTPHNSPAKELSDAARLDQLLDKIHISGFKSLTKAERAELQDLSQKVTK
ncbi:MAG: rhomboid family intramembrane serine protease [Muribaculaceae bacterium]|nr:rhomboid family intramembrane serine protease [Muribaculaceae bacterium]